MAVVLGKLTSARSPGCGTCHAARFGEAGRAVQLGKLTSARWPGFWNHHMPFSVRMPGHVFAFVLHRSSLEEKRKRSHRISQSTHTYRTNRRRIASHRQSVIASHRSFHPNPVLHPHISALFRIRWVGLDSAASLSYRHDVAMDVDIASRTAAVTVVAVVDSRFARRRCRRSQ